MAFALCQTDWPSFFVFRQLCMSWPVVSVGHQSQAFCLQPIVSITHISAEVMRRSGYNSGSEQCGCACAAGLQVTVCRGTSTSLSAHLAFLVSIVYSFAQGCPFPSFSLQLSSGTPHSLLSGSFRLTNLIFRCLLPKGPWIEYGIAKIVGTAR